MQIEGNITLEEAIRIDYERICRDVDDVLEKLHINDEALTPLPSDNVDPILLGKWQNAKDYLDEVLHTFQKMQHD